MAALLGAMLAITFLFDVIMWWAQRRPGTIERRLARAVLAGRLAPALYQRRMALLAHHQRPGGTTPSRGRRARGGHDDAVASMPCPAARPTYGGHEPDKAGAAMSGDYGLWPLVVLDTVIFTVFAGSFFHPVSKRDWRVMGVLHRVPGRAVHADVRLSADDLPAGRAAGIAFPAAARRPCRRAPVE